MRCQHFTDVSSQLTSEGSYAKRRRDLKLGRNRVTHPNSCEMTVLDQEFVVANKLGIHARVAAQIVKVASQFKSDIQISKSGNTVSGKSILDIMTLVCPQGSTVRISACGPDASDALYALAGLFQTKFGES